MKINLKIISLTLSLIILLWSTDIIVDYAQAGPGNSFSQLIKENSEANWISRTIISGLFLIFGIIMSLVIESRKALEETLKNQEEEFRRLFDIAGEALVVLDARGEVKYWNDGAEYLFRYLQKEALGKEFRHFLAHQSSGHFEEEFNLLKKSMPGFKGRKTLTLIGRRKDNIEFPCQITFTTTRIHHRWLSLAFIHDLSRQKEKEKKLTFTEWALNSSPHGLAIIDLHGKIILANPSLVRLWKMPIERFEGENFIKLWESEEEISDFIFEVQEKGRKSIKTHAQRKDGSKFFAQVFASPIKNDHYQTVAILVSVQDITEFQNQAIFQQLKDKFEEVITNLATCFINLAVEEVDQEISKALELIGQVLNIDYCYLYLFSPGRKRVYLKDFWHSPEGSIESLPQEIEASELGPIRENILNKEIYFLSPLNEASPALEQSYFFKSLIWRGTKSFLAIPLVFRLKVLGFFGVETITRTRDWEADLISLLRLAAEILANTLERKAMEEELALSLAEKESLLRELHHRIKNNLQFMASLLNLQLRKTKNKKLRQILTESQARIRSMSMVHESLYASQDLAGVNIAAYITSLVSYLSQIYRPEQDKLRIKLDIEEITVETNTAILCGLIINELLSNSFKYGFPEEYLQKLGKPGEIQINFKTLKDGRFQLKVRDNGIGLPPDFDLEKATSVGLRLVDSLVKQHKGSLKVERKGGTALTIVCPVST
jgi:PAS domain S-box-containing protein